MALTRDEAPSKEVVTRDTPKTTAFGNRFIAPAGWSVATLGTTTVLEPPEGESHVVLVDVEAETADAAVEAAWAAYMPDKKWQLKAAMPGPDKDGWTRIARYDYITSPNEKRDVSASVYFANDVWTVVLYDMAQDVGEKRLAQIALIFGQLLPKGFERESFAGKAAAVLDAGRIAELSRFIQAAQEATGVPGVSLGLVQDGKVVFAGGFGVRRLGRPEKVDADTRYIIASNSKALTTLMLARLVEEKKLTWETPAAELLSSFQLGDADTTKRVEVKHLICACTGMPRQDMEWLLEFRRFTPQVALSELGKMQPTSKFGELYQYSNPLAAAAGYIGGHVAYPQLELGRAYDEAMRTRVFQPLGMKRTTFDFKRAEAGNFASPHAPDVDDKQALAIHRANYSIIPVRPAGGAWSSVRDVLRYVQMELDRGKLPNGKRYLAEETLLARRTPQVSIGKDTTYGMGLMVDTRYDVTLVRHGGDMIGYHSDMMWLPDHGVGAVVLTNGDPGWFIRSIFRRKLLEVLFDGRPEADREMAAMTRVFFEARRAERKLLKVPAEASEVEKLAEHYENAALGAIRVVRKGAATVFDFGEFSSEVASKRHPDGSVSFVTIVPGFDGLELVVGQGDRRTLVLRDAQHEYVFEQT